MTIYSKLEEGWAWNRVFYLRDRNYDNGDPAIKEVAVQVDTHAKFTIASLVLGVNHKKQGKFDPTYQPAPYRVLAAFDNNTYLLATDMERF